MDDYFLSLFKGKDCLLLFFYKNLDDIIIF